MVAAMSMSSWPRPGLAKTVVVPVSLLADAHRLSLVAAHTQSLYSGSLLVRLCAPCCKQVLTMKKLLCAACPAAYGCTVHEQVCSRRLRPGRTSGHAVLPQQACARPA